MNWKDVLIGGLIAICLVLLWLFISSETRRAWLAKAIEKLEKENEDLAEENEELKIEYLDLLQQVMETKEKVTPDVIKELDDLKEKAKTLDTLVHVELSSVIQQVNTGHNEKAVKDLAKIIENVLKMKAQKEAEFKDQPTLNNLIKFASVKQWLPAEDVAVAHSLRNLRNEESHDLAVKKPLHEMGFLLFAGIKLINRLYQPNQ